jgi:hypothetical protein
MYLEGSLTKKKFNPTEIHISEAFKTFDQENSDEYLILSKDEMTYIQTAISDYQEEGFIIEYQEGSLSNHFITVDKNIPVEKVVIAFISYLNCDDDWKTSFEWEPLVLDEEDL